MKGMRLTEEQYKALLAGRKNPTPVNEPAPQKKSKMGNVKTELDGQIFDSGEEARRYSDLKLLERAGEIQDLRTQVTYLLIPKQQKSSGGTERSVTYTADFVYTRKGVTVVEDSKGHRTQQYIIRRKLMLWVHGIEVQEV